MFDTILNRKSVGRFFEDQVATVLTSLGFTVYQELYVPYNPTSDKYTEVDIVAVRDNVCITCECKCLSGTLSGGIKDRTWTWDSDGTKTQVANPCKQSWSHGRALWDNLHIPVVEIIVFRDGLELQCPQDHRMCYLSQLGDKVVHIASALSESVRFDLSAVASALTSWSHPSNLIIQKQILKVHEAKNAPAVSAIEQHIGSPYYCVMLSCGYLFCYVDADGHTWGTELLKEAALFEHIEEAYTVAGDYDGAEVCTLELGYIEAVSDLPDEFDGMTTAEYADAIGARPW